MSFFFFKLFNNVVLLINNVVFQVYSKVIQLHIYMYLFFFKFFSHLGCYIILSRVPCATQQIPAGHPFKQSFLKKFLAVLGLCCCARAFSSCGERVLIFITVCRHLIAVASLVVEHGRVPSARASVFVARRLSSCGAWA